MFVSGVGVVTPFGLGTEALLDGLFNKRNCFRLHKGCYRTSKYEAFCGRISTEVIGELAEELERLGATRAGDDISSMYLRYAALQAMSDAGLTSSADAGRAAIIIGNLEPHLRPFCWERREETGQRNRYDLQSASNYGRALASVGPFPLEVITVHNTCASGNAALEIGLGLIRDGLFDTVLVAATDAFSERIFAGFETLGVLGDEPCRPFSKRRKYITISEGAAVLVLQSKAKRIPYAELLTVFSSNDASHPTNPSPQGIANCMARAVELAGLKSSQIGFLFAHGTGSRANDAAEAAYFAQAYAETDIAAIKGLTGHLMGVAGALGNVVSALSARLRKLPPNAISEEELEYPIKLSPDPVIAQAGELFIQNNAFGFGGTNSVSIFKAT
ncbi:beta-ketoacyl synthase N-terminal-like domain-containing protein [Rhizobium sp. SJZ105]|uniref:beta-ketoacyl synthase N-terminal-like domain-containing protein n=1 Tax=Rhizobium sp. SJZ105 TaxID=2572678 RepID=UPI002AA526FC|nr:beta-ketoacyl synthase N-terminal-like domain-containing protein [Rhizobium sp. SJZ105]